MKMHLGQPSAINDKHNVEKTSTVHHATVFSTELNGK